MNALSHCVRTILQLLSQRLLFIKLSQARREVISGLGRIIFSGLFQGLFRAFFLKKKKKKKGLAFSGPFRAPKISGLGKSPQPPPLSPGLARVIPLYKDGGKDD